MAAVALVLSAATPSAHAQVGFYAQGSASDFDLSATDWQYGGTVGLYYVLVKFPFLALSVDGRADMLGTGPNRTYSGLAGPRLSTRLPVTSIKPYLEALAGAVDVKYSPGNTQVSATKLDYRVVGGIDLGVLPHVDWRAAEASYEMQSVDSRKSLTLSTGIVIRIP
jgi:hypothetical protein